MASHKEKETTDTAKGTSKDNESSEKTKIYPPTRVIVFRCIFELSIIGLIVPFAAEVILPFFFPCVNVNGVAIWNQFVSIILGVIATIMSIVSLVLCFRSDSSMTEAYNRIEKKLAGVDNHLGTIENNTRDVLQNTIFLSNLTRRGNGNVKPVPSDGCASEDQEEEL